MKKKSRAQAAIYDGILLLLLAALSSTIIFTYIGTTYGKNEDKVLRSAYELNYLQSVMKSMYYIDANTLTKIKSDDVSYYLDLETVEGCPSLENYRGSISVTDLLKKDLGDPNDPVTGDPTTLLDDKFGETAKVPGRTAMRCAMKELMKPFAYAGYKYYVEARDPNGVTNKLCTVGPGESYSECNIPVEGAQITNSQDTDVLSSSMPPNGCDQAAKKSTQLLSVSSPFRVLKTEEVDNALSSKIENYKIRICVWPAANAQS